MATKDKTQAIVTVADLLVQVQRLNDEQYRSFREQFIQIDKRRQASSMNKYNVGDVVKFNARGRTVHAKVTGYGRKRLLGVEVTSSKPHVPAGGRWKFSGMSCTLVTAAAQ